MIADWICLGVIITVDVLRDGVSVFSYLFAKGIEGFHDIFFVVGISGAMIRTGRILAVVRIWFCVAQFRVCLRFPF